MNLRDRCEALVRQLRGRSGIVAKPQAIIYRNCADALQAALDATEGETLDGALPVAVLHDSWQGTAARLEKWAKQSPRHSSLEGQTMEEAALFIRHFLAIDQAMKESKP